jgi:hypothetical protein
MGMEGGSTKEGRGFDSPPYPGHTPFHGSGPTQECLSLLTPFWQSTRGGQEAKNHLVQYPTSHDIRSGPKM